jgi:branched-subunit amino acid transport protein
MNAWTVVLAAGLVSYLLRLSMIASNRFRLPSSLDGAVALVAPAAFAALAASSLAALVVAAPTVPLVLPPVIAVAAAGIAVVRTGKSYLAVLVGMPTFWVAAALVSL